MWDLGSSQVAQISSQVIFSLLEHFFLLLSLCTLSRKCLSQFVSSNRQSFVLSLLPLCVLLMHLHSDSRMKEISIVVPQIGS